MFGSNVPSINYVVARVWGNLAPPKVDLFVWLVIWGKINTKDNLGRKGILQGDDLLYVFCGSVSKFVDHLFVHYENILCL